MPHFHGRLRGVSYGVQMHLHLSVVERSLYSWYFLEPFFVHVCGPHKHIYSHTQKRTYTLTCTCLQICEAVGFHSVTQSASDTREYRVSVCMYVCMCVYVCIYSWMHACMCVMCVSVSCKSVSDICQYQVDVCMYECVCVCTRNLLLIYLSPICMYACMHVYIRVCYLYRRTNTIMYKCFFMYIHMYVHAYVCICICMCMHMYVHITFTTPYLSVDLCIPSHCWIGGQWGMRACACVWICIYIL